VNERRGLLLAIAVTWIVGCDNAMPPAADPQRARSALQAALDAWKNGESLEALQTRSPAVYFNDELSSDKRLVKYDIQSEAANGRGWRCDVLLTLDSGGSKETQRRIGYQIDTDPAIVIIQQP
jgi:hypothetical protein